MPYAIVEYFADDLRDQSDGPSRRGSIPLCLTRYSESDRSLRRLAPKGANPSYPGNSKLEIRGGTRR